MDTSSKTPSRKYKAFVILSPKSVWRPSNVYIYTFQRSLLRPQIFHFLIISHISAFRLSDRPGFVYIYTFPRRQGVHIAVFEKPLKTKLFCLRPPEPSNSVNCNVSGTSCFLSYELYIVTFGDFGRNRPETLLFPLHIDRHFFWAPAPTPKSMLKRYRGRHF